MNGWTLVESTPMPQRKDRPNISVNMTETWEMPLADWRANNKNTLKLPYANFDAETFSHFYQPNMFASVIVYNYAHSKIDGVAGAKFLLNKDGKRIKGPNGLDLWEADPDNWPKHWNRCDKHTKTKNTKAMTKCDDCTQTRRKPKYVGKYWTKNDPKTSVIRMVKMWCWNDEVVQRFIPTWMDCGVDTVYAHNTAVDIIAFLHEAEPTLSHPLEKFTQCSPMEKSRILMKGSGILTAKIDVAPYYNRNAKKPYFAMVYDYNEGKKVKTEEYMLEFNDSLSLLPMPLSVLGESIGVPKGTTPALFMQTEKKFMEIKSEYVEYCINDCVVLFTVMQEYWKIVKSCGYHGTTLPLTAGTLSSQMVAYANVTECAKTKGQGALFEKKEKSWKYKTIVNEPELDTICREAMVGGRTQVFHSEVYKGEAYGIDANSMYASIQCNTNLAFPFYPTQVAITTEQEVHQCLEKGEGVLYAHWVRPATDNIGMFSHKEEGKGLDWTLTEGTRWMSFPEYRHAEAKGYTMTPMECPKHEMYGIASPRLNYNPFTIVKAIYDKRLEMKEAGDTKEALMKCLLVNSFGKFVERNQDMFLVEQQEADAMSLFPPETWDFTGVSNNPEQGVEYGYMKEHDGNHQPLLKRADTTANMMGLYITAYSRINLYEVGCEIGAEHLLYCDTDSWKHTNADAKCPYEGNELGQWKLEQCYDSWESVAPKQYKYHAIWDEKAGDCSYWKARVKGASLKMIDAETLDLKGSVTFKRVVGLKESWRSKKYTAGEWIVVTKQLGKTIAKNEAQEMEQ